MTHATQHAVRPYLVDTTLRDGEQAPGVAFSAAGKVALARRIARVGVGEMEIGTPAIGEVEQEAMRQIVALGLPVRLTAWCRARPEDLDAAAGAGVSSVHLSLPASELHMRLVGKTCPMVLADAERLATQAMGRFEYVSVGAQDASRADPPFLRELLTAAQEGGADRFRLADTVGVWTPRQTAAAVLALRGRARGIELGFHAHNDFGLAAANALAALEAGADCVDVTVLGLGERAGNAALEQVLVAGQRTQGLFAGAALAGLAPLCDLTARLAGRNIADDRPLVGGCAFAHESGIHVRGILADPASYEPLSPQSVGRRRRRFVLGKHSGTASLRHAIDSLQLAVPDSLVPPLLAAVRQRAIEQRGPVDPRQLREMVAELSGPP